MITIFQATSNYCQKTSLPKPSQADTQEIGRIVSADFRKRWIFDKHPTLEPGTLVPDCGFAKVFENGEPIIVQAYPDNYLVRMDELIHKFYLDKKAREQKNAERGSTAAPAGEKQFGQKFKQRSAATPTKINRQPVYSAKPRRDQ